jgi:hypothetical protein
MTFSFSSEAVLGEVDETVIQMVGRVKKENVFEQAAAPQV